VPVAGIQSVCVRTIVIGIPQLFRASWFSVEEQCGERGHTRCAPVFRDQAVKRHQASPNRASSRYNAVSHIALPSDQLPSKTVN
jgi:hypothetical protein